MWTLLCFWFIKTAAPCYLCTGQFCLVQYGVNVDIRSNETHFYIYRYHLGYKHSSIKEATSWILHGKTNTWIIKLYLHKFPQFISQLTNQTLRLKRHWTGDRTDYLRLSTHRLNQLPQVQIDKTFLFLLSHKHSAFRCYLVTTVICFQGEKVDSLLNQACLNRWKVQCHKHEGI